MSAIDRVMGIVAKRNFDNDISQVIENLRRYKMMDDPIQIGGSSLDGATVEFLIAMCEEMDAMDLRLLKLETALIEVNVAAKEANKKIEAREDEAMQTTIDGGEEPHAEIAEAANPAPKKPAATKAAASKAAK